MIEKEWMVLVAIAVAILVPAYTVVLSAAAYLGKIWALRALFKTHKGDTRDDRATDG